MSFDVITIYICYCLSSGLPLWLAIGVLIAFLLLVLLLLLIGQATAFAIVVCRGVPVNFVIVPHIGFAVMACQP